MGNSITILFVTLLIPIVSAGIAFSIQKKYSWLSPIIGAILTLSAAIIVLFPLFSDTQLITQYSIPWLSIGDTTVSIGILSTPVTRLMAAVVLFVSAMVHIFSIGYMANDKNTDRYFGFLGLFTFAMLGLVYSTNLLITFCFWELIGFCSYRLIAHLQEKPAAARAATKAFLLTKTGDIGFLIGVLILWTQNGTLELSTITATGIWSTVAGVCILLGVVGKSAQFPLFNWLPDAMQGPTPVSALIHAATLVAAGIFILVQLVPVFTPTTLWIMTGIGIVSALMGAIGAWLATDIKKILAYSTISQLGFMVLALGLGEVTGAFTHLLHHALFKAGLFLAAGSIIHAMHQATFQAEINVQDIRNLGGLRKQMPFTFIGFAICAAALAGIPGTSGYLSKEMILTAVHQKNIWWIEFAVWVIVFTTPLYIFRLFWFAFLKPVIRTFSVQEAPWIMRLPVLLIAAGSITFLFQNGHPASFATQILHTAFEVPPSIIIISAVVTGISLLTAWLSRNLSARTSDYIIQRFLDYVNLQIARLVAFIAELTTLFDKKWIDRSIHAVAYSKITLAHISGWADRNVVDGSVQGVLWITRGLGNATRSVVNGKIQSYLLWAMAGLLIFILWMFY
ncbi:MAG TPA: NADH-quinone oxidoreductase subunit L [Cyclobacteriaceae bacterium]|jgi:NADH-quinone oxidoreductase subunit L|nr:NADH-quinone oxidoreductase subunit L [Cytophagales bacterium]HRE65907.1 NADH-quinone oxidoreductase subunit L [Cyclobacteriaceae bacterium]HRF33751.1 NADH-quinone oxidoreductase subunit L [Cyclobacteriaceae bacterium]